MAHARGRPPYSFWIQLREIQALDGTHSRHVNQAPKNQVKWLPPECPQGFHVIHTWPWHIWSPRSDGRQLSSASPDPSEKLYNLPPQVQHYGTTSLFYSTEISGFFEVPYDCTKVHVSDRREEYSEDGWNRISFKRHRNRTAFPNLWTVGHAHESYQIDANITDSWNDLLLPSCFVNGVQSRNTFTTCDLAGKLSIILGLIAFTAPREDFVRRVEESFRPRGTTDYQPTWRSNRPKDQGILPRRGLIVDIACDPSHCTKEQLKRWEWGDFGPILTSNANYNLTANQNNSLSNGTRPVPNQPSNRYYTNIQYAQPR